MMTHPPSRTVAVAGGRANPGHTFGSLPRTSPSGTMAHHKAEMPTPTATAALQQKTKARTPHGGAENDMSEANARYAQYKAQPPPSFDKCLPCGDSSTENKRPSSAASSQDSTQQSQQQRQPLSNKPGAFAVDAKAGRSRGARPPPRPSRVNASSQRAARSSSGRRRPLTRPTRRSKRARSTRRRAARSRSPPSAAAASLRLLLQAPPPER